MRLEVWLEACPRPVGVLERRRDKSLTFTYTAPYDSSHRISMALPVRAEPYGDAVCTAYFGNLLFEGKELDRVASDHRVDRDDIGALLYHLGADCAGAISVTPEGTGPGKRPGFFPDDYEEIGSDRLIEALASLHFYGRLPEGSEHPSPIAGVQPKLGLVQCDGRYFLPKAGSKAPTTHILKVSPNSELGLTRRETALLSLARELGIGTASCEHITFDDPRTGAEIDAILLERFDRRLNGNTISRIHAEDLCQALGVASYLKYQRHAVREDIMFSAKAVGQLAEETADPDDFRIRFFEQTLFNLAVGNNDNHGKNASLLYDGSHVRLAPLYDVVPVIMDPKVTHELAFALGGATYSEDVTQQRLLGTMHELGLASPELSARWTEMLRKVAIPGVGYLAQRGGKGLADAVAAQLKVIEGALEIELGIPDRDYFPRNERDVEPGALSGGWGRLGG